MNVLTEEKRQQVLALGQLGWSLRRIQEAVGVRRETASAYLKAAGVPVRGPGARRGERLAKAAITSEVSTDLPPPTSGLDEQPSGSIALQPAATPEEVSTDPNSVQVPGRSPSASACEPFRELIEQALGRGRNAMAIWQDLVDDHGFRARYASVKRFVNLIELDHALRKLRLSGIADVLEVRLRQAQTEKMAPIDFVSGLVSDELLRRQDRLFQRRTHQASFRDPERSLEPERVKDLRDLLLRVPIEQDVLAAVLLASPYEVNQVPDLQPLVDERGPDALQKPGPIHRREGSTSGSQEVFDLALGRYLRQELEDGFGVGKTVLHATSYQGEHPRRWASLQSAVLRVNIPTTDGP